MRVGCIYLLRNLKNGKGYVGMALDAEQRWVGHVRDAFVRRLDYPLYRAIRKYGPENFTAEVVHRCTEALLPMAERCFILKFGTHIRGGSGYNQTLGGDGVLGLKFSVESRKQLSTSLKKYFQNHPEARETMRSVHLGRKLSSEHRMKVVAVLNRIRTVPLTKEQHSHRSAMARERWARPEYRLRQAVGQKQAQQDPATKRARSQGAKNRYSRPEERQRTAARTRAQWAERRANVG